MLSYQVNRSIEIEKTQSEIINYLKDCTRWPEWSPWIILEPDCELTYSDEQGVVGAGYQWNGNELVLVPWFSKVLKSIDWTWSFTSFGL